MKAAVSAWNGRVSPVFDVARTLLVFDVGKEGISGRRELALGTGIAARIEAVAEAGVQTLLCGAISQTYAGMLAARGIRVMPFISGDVEDVIQAFLSGTLGCPRYAMPGCGRRAGCGGRRRRMGRPL